MKWLVVGLVAAFLSKALAKKDLCSVCACVGRDGIAPLVINCDGSDGTTDLHVEKNDLNGLEKVKRFSVANYRSLHFSDNAFAAVKNLETLSVDKVENFSLQKGIFSSMDALVIQNVKILELKERALQGVDAIMNIKIYNSTLPVVSKWALYDLKNLSSVELNNVKIHNLQTEAIQLSMGTKSKVSFINCELKKAEKKSLTVEKTNIFEMVNTTLRDVASSSISVTSHVLLYLEGNIFYSGVERNFMFGTSRNVTIIKNLFEKLPSQFLQYFNSSTVIFESNTIREIDEKELAILFEKDNATIKFNSMECHCITSPSTMLPAFENNYCTGCKVPIRNFVKSCREDATLHKRNRLDKLCKELPTTTTQYRHDFSHSTDPAIDISDITVVSAEKIATDLVHTEKPNGTASALSTSISTFALLVLTKIMV